MNSYTNSSVIVMLLVADASGKRESGILDGNAFYEGRAPECLRANQDISASDVEMTSHYCSAYWWTGFISDVFANVMDSLFDVTVNITDKVYSYNVYVTSMRAI